MKGKYYCELYDGNRRRSLCLRTDSYELACQRYAAGLKELRKKIRAEHEAAKPQERLAWLPEEVEAIKARYKRKRELLLSIQRADQQSLPILNLGKSLNRDTEHI